MPGKNELTGCTELTGLTGLTELTELTGLIALTGLTGLNGFLLIAHLYECLCVCLIACSPLYTLEFLLSFCCPNPIKGLRYWSLFASSPLGQF